MEREVFAVLSDDAMIVGQYLYDNSGAPRPLVVLCHGAPSGNPPEPGDGGYPAFAERFFNEGYNACFFNFRGSGESSGNIDFLGWTRDLEAVLDYLWNEPNFNPGKIYLVGISAGAATSIYVTAHDSDSRIAGVAACASPADFSIFTSRETPDEIIARYREIGSIRDDGFPPSVDEWFAHLEQVTPERYAGDIAPRPLLIVHGAKDETVPVEHAERLYRAAGEPKELVLLPEAGHRMRQDENAVRAVLAWLAARTGVQGPQVH